MVSKMADYIVQSNRQVKTDSGRSGSENCMLTPLMIKARQNKALAQCHKRIHKGIMIYFFSHTFNHFFYKSF